MTKHVLKMFPTFSKYAFPKIFFLFCSCNNFVLDAMVVAWYWETWYEVIHLSVIEAEFFSRYESDRKARKYVSKKCRLIFQFLPIF